MPKVRPSEKLPDGFEKIAEQLDVYEAQMRATLNGDSAEAEKAQPAETDAAEGEANGADGATTDKRSTTKKAVGANRSKREAKWPIARINFARTRYVVLMCRRREISQEVVDFCVDAGFIDGGLMSKWKLPGYERLCCTQCINPKNFTGGAASGCICRVPAAQRRGVLAGCATCGCSGCCSADAPVRAPAAAKPKGTETPTAE
jgi:bud site selection protein 31